jgi:murein L,D-transpeptidase YafK
MTRTALVLSALLWFSTSACSAARPIPKKERIDRLVIYKADHRMEAWSGKRLLKTYGIAIGSGDAGPKRQRGDKKTPEGRYKIDRRFVSKKFHRFLHISYPNQKDRETFARLKLKGSIGGDIGIHGEKSSYGWLPHKWVDWTQGCIAVDNDEIEELYRLVVPGAVVIIYP